MFNHACARCLCLSLSLSLMYTQSFSAPPSTFTIPALSLSLSLSLSLTHTHTCTRSPLVHRHRPSLYQRLGARCLRGLREEISRFRQACVSCEWLCRSSTYETKYACVQSNVWSKCIQKFQPTCGAMYVCGTKHACIETKSIHACI
jgi:hypothetical protein